MTQHFIFTDLEEKHAAPLWGQQPICIGHRLHELPLFARDGLAALIQTYPREHYGIIHMGAQHTDRRYWREGDLNGLPGEQVIEAIAKGRLWLNLRNVGEVDRRYGELLDELFAELHERIPGFKSYGHKCGILISSPNAQVYYHADLPGQLLFQIMGRKRLYFYPPQKPFIGPEDIEHIAISGLEVDLPYADWYDDYARIYEFEPGQMVHWPHTAPHRVENHDCLNVSMTVEFWTGPIRRAQIVNLANGVLRYRFGRQPQSRTISGLSFWTKAAMWRAFRQTSWIKNQRAAHKQIEFRLDRKVPGAIVDLGSAPQ